jgi:hypothetical protein
MERSIDSDVCLFSRLFHSAVSVTDHVSVEEKIVFDEFERSRVEMIVSTYYSRFRLEIPNKIMKFLSQEERCCGRDLSRPLRGRKSPQSQCVTMSGTQQHEV